MTVQKTESNNLRHIYRKIKNLDDFEPSPKVNETFSNLVTGIVDENLEGDLSNQEIQELRTLCGKSEFQLEKHWSQRIIESEDPKKEMEKFPYYTNYEKLVAFEYATVVGCCKDLEKNAVFVGGGPLPFSALILAKDYDFDITIIDRDSEAVENAQKLCGRLDLEIEVIQSNAEEFKGYNDYSLIHVAAMVGGTEDEEIEVFQSIKSQIDKHSHIAARTVHGRRKLLYRPVSKRVKKMFNVEAEKRPSRDVINSTVVMTVPKN